MKKLTLLLFVACVTLSANAQFYVGGSASLWVGSDDTNVSLTPEVGYVLNDHWAIGTEIGFGHSSRTAYDYFGEYDVKMNSFILSPYARFTYLKLGKVGLFVDGGLDYAMQKQKDVDAVHGVRLGLKPGVALSLTERLSLVAKFGFLGFDHDYNGLGNSGGFSFTGNDLSFGFYVSF